MKQHSRSSIFPGRFTALLFLFSLSCSLLSAQAFDFIPGGEYVAFHDSRGETDFFRAFYFNRAETGDLYVTTRSIDLDSGEGRNYILVIREDSDGLPELVQAHGLAGDEPAEFIQTMADLMNFLNFAGQNHRLSGNDDIPGNEIGIRDIDGPVATYRFAPLIPGFGFRQQLSLEDGRVFYRLIAAGYLSFDRYDEFYDFAPVAASDYPGRGRLPITPGEVLTGDLGSGYIVDLDSRWERNNSLGFQGYWLKRYSIRDSQIMLERIDKADFDRYGLDGPEEFLRLVAYRDGSMILFDRWEYRVEDGHYILSYYLIDQNGALNFALKDMWLEDGAYLILNFSSFADVYDANPDYYRSILASVRRR
jgi:hypothetical protein